MKIERINDAQMKFILNKTDLDKRNLNIQDLAYGSNKTQELFQDIIETASRDYSFNHDETPLMIEAVPVSKTSIMIILTKVSSPVPYQEDAMEIKAQQADIATPGLFGESASKPKTKKVILKNMNDTTMIYRFDNMDTLTLASYQLERYNAESAVYKYDEDYILVVSVKRPHTERIRQIEHVLEEYGSKVKNNNNIVIYHIKEAGEVIIKENAIRILASL